MSKGAKWVQALTGVGILACFTFATFHFGLLDLALCLVVAILTAVTTLAAIWG